MKNFFFNNRGESRLLTHLRSIVKATKAGVGGVSGWSRRLWKTVLLNVEDGDGRWRAPQLQDGGHEHGLVGARLHRHPLGVQVLEQELLLHFSAFQQIWK